MVTKAEVKRHHEELQRRILELIQDLELKTDLAGADCCLRCHRLNSQDNGKAAHALKRARCLGPHIRFFPTPI